MVDAALNPRITISLLVVLAALGGVLLYTDQQQPGTPSSGAEQPAEVFNFSPADLQQIELRRESTPRSFKKADGDKWNLQPSGDPADSSRVQSLVTRLSNLRATRRITPTESDLSVYGLVNPRIVVRLTLADGATHELWVGEKTPVQTGNYAQAEQGGDVYVLPSVLVDEIERLIDQPVAPTPTPARPTSTPTLGPTAPPIGAPTLTPIPSLTRPPSPTPRA